MSSSLSAVHLVALARTPFGRYFGALSPLSMPALAAKAIAPLLTVLPDGAADRLYLGVGLGAGGHYAPARQAVLASDLPDGTASLAVDRACASGMTALGLGWQAIRAGQAARVICGGAESLSNAPGWVRRRARKRPGDAGAWGQTPAIYDPLLLEAPGRAEAIASYTGREAQARGIDRDAQDAWALASHQRYAAAEARGIFADERIPLVELARDESARAGLTIESLGRLDTLYGGPTVTAGNAPGLSDGAACCLLAGDEELRALGLPSLARLVDYVSVAAATTASSWLPAVAIRQLLARRSLRLEQLALLEINEAYAATVLVSLLELADGDRELAAELGARTNVNGGAIAIGHPLGASGARIVLTLARELARRGGGLGVAAICGAYGQAEALLLEVSAA